MHSIVKYSVSAFTESVGEKQHHTQTIIYNPIDKSQWLHCKRVSNTLFGSADVYAKCKYDEEKHCYISDSNNKDLILVKESDLQLIQSGKTMHGNYTKERPQDEVDILQSFPPHPNVCSISFTLSDSNHHFIAYPYYNGCDLFEYIAQGPKMTEMDTLKIFQGMVAAVQHLHHNNIVHFDISPENFVMHHLDNGDIIPILIDFGLARKCNADYAGNDIFGLDMPIGKTVYMAPEMFEHFNDEGGNYLILRGKPCDIWTLGSTLFCMLFKTFICDQCPSLIRDERFFTIFQSEKHGMEKFFGRYNLKVSPTISKLLKSMLTLNPTKRIEIDELASFVQSTIDELKQTLN